MPYRTVGIKSTHWICNRCVDQSTRIQCSHTHKHIQINSQSKLDAVKYQKDQIRTLKYFYCVRDSLYQPSNKWTYHKNLQKYETILWLPQCRAHNVVFFPVFVCWRQYFIWFGTFQWFRWWQNQCPKIIVIGDSVRCCIFFWLLLVVVIVMHLIRYGNRQRQSK